jgi:hypothetical protein
MSTFLSEDWTFSPAKAIDVLERAAEFNLTDAYRDGCTIDLPGMGDVLISGDIHGNGENLQAIINEADLDANPERHLILQELLHGGPRTESGGCLSVSCLLRAGSLKLRFPDRVHFLLGNHELSESHGVNLVKGGERITRVFEQGLQELFGPHSFEVRLRLNRAIDTMPLAARTAHGIFISHSTPRLEDIEIFDHDLFARRLPFRADPYAPSVFALVWGRDFSEEASDAFARLVDAELFIVGHTACIEGFQCAGSRHFILDSKDDAGCYIVMPLDRAFTRDELASLLYRIIELPEQIARLRGRRD